MKNTPKQLLAWAFALALLLGTALGGGWLGYPSEGVLMASDPCNPDEGDESGDEGGGAENMPSRIVG